MNERIKELIFKTDEWLESNAQSDRWEREMKFAELIVKECIKSIRPYDASGHFEETIREHFYGVNE